MCSFDDKILSTYKHVSGVLTFISVAQEEWVYYAQSMALESWWAQAFQQSTLYLLLKIFRVLKRAHVGSGPHHFIWEGADRQYGVYSLYIVM